MTAHDPFRGSPLNRPVSSVDSVTRAELADQAAKLGLSTKGTKAELAARIRAGR
jgi:hypothetical protein